MWVTCDVSWLPEMKRTRLCVHAFMRWAYFPHFIDISLHASGGASEDKNACFLKACKVSVLRRCVTCPLEVTLREYTAISALDVMAMNMNMDNLNDSPCLCCSNRCWNSMKNCNPSKWRSTGGAATEHAKIQDIFRNIYSGHPRGTIKLGIRFGTRYK